MCVIYHKQKENALNFDTLEQMWDANPDGMGFAFPDGDSVHIVKGIMTKAAMYEKVTAYWVDIMNTDTVFHFRVATSGLTDAANTHPFPIGGDTTATDTMTKIAIAHNGVICKTSGDKSDTHELAIMYADMGMDLQEIIADLKAEARISYSKFAVITPDGVTRIGQWEKIDGGYVSNTYWRGWQSYWYGSHDLTPEENVKSVFDDADFDFHDWLDGKFEGDYADYCPMCGEYMVHGECPACGFEYTDSPSL